MKKIKIIPLAVIASMCFMMAGCYGTTTKAQCQSSKKISKKSDSGLMVNGKDYVIFGCDGVISPYNP